MAVGGASLVSVNLARVRDDVFSAGRTPRGAKPRQTGIDKRPATGPVRLAKLGVAGDTICDTRHHGGPDQAVYAYAQEDLEWWQEELAAELALPLRPGAVGENLTTRGLAVSGAVIGEKWQIGTALLEVSVPRIPCRTFAAFWNVTGLIKRFTAAGRPGAYLRVLTEGDVQAGDDVTLVHRPAHGLTIRETLRALTGDRGLAAKLLTAPELPAGVHRDARVWLAG
jgi:MOSC domain-containing protein YiiM